MGNFTQLWCHKNLTCLVGVQIWELVGFQLSTSACWSLSQSPNNVIMWTYKVVQFPKVKNNIPTFWGPSRLESYIKIGCINYKSVITRKELSIPENPAVLENPPATIYKNSHHFCIAIPCPALLLSSATKNLQLSTFMKVENKKGVSFPGARAYSTTWNMKPKVCFNVICIISSLPWIISIMSSCSQLEQLTALPCDG